jgi:hypothetical protein
MYRGRAMSGYGDAFIGLDTSKAKNAVALAEVAAKCATWVSSRTRRRPRASW